MSLFENRERAFENLFVHEEDLRFRAAARRNRKLAAWAAARMSLPEHEASSYQSFIVRLGAFFGDDGVRERILHDLGKAGAGVSDHRIRRLMDELIAAEIAREAPPRPVRPGH
ncbi:MAG: ATPase inhibitor subunit zeta [Beijerinckiaceae bacterium]